MGHLVGKDLYRRLGDRIDGLTARAPWSETLRAILQELYTPQEADLILKLPFSMESLPRLVQVTGLDEAALRRRLDPLCAKGLVVDLWLNGSYHYMLSPMAIGIFEFTMMRHDPGVDHAKMARLFHEYMQGGPMFYAANFAHGERVSLMRTVPHEAAFEEHVEVLDYERASALVASQDRFSLGTCSCRHKALHQTGQACRTPLETCMSFGQAADYLIRHGLARASSRGETLEVIARSRELGLVLNADNVQRGGSFICHCCKCCCALLAGVNQFGYPNCVVTSTWLAEIVPDRCSGCGRCVEACPVNAMKPGTQPVPAGEQPARAPGERKAAPQPVVDTGFCIGCGVCVTRCARSGVRLVARGQRVIHPETTFERVVLQCLERDTFQNVIFDDPARVTHKFLRGLIGGFLRIPPVKRALMSDLLRSRFLDAIKGGARALGRGWAVDL